MIKERIGYTIIMFHNSINLIIPLTLLFSNNFYTILFIQVIIVIILISWYIFNDCILKAIEDYFLNTKSPVINYDKYHTIIICNKEHRILNNIIENKILTSTIIFYYFFSIYKLIKLYNK